MIKRFSLGIILSIILFSCGSTTTAVPQKTKLAYTIDLNQRGDDKFIVELQVSNLTNANRIFNFASTAPGTYQVHDIGRFVENFKVFDASGQEIPSSKITVNKFQISKPSQVSKISYTVKETWDTPVDENKLYEMCGTSLEQDHALINGQAVFGFFSGLQSTPFKIKLLYPKEWQVGTALDLKTDGTYLAKNYDHAVDSPILLGRLTKASTKVSNTNVDIYTYSKTDKISSEQILASMQNMLDAADKFIGGLPVDRYTFLFHFEDQSVGAWEHSFSSEYIYREDEWKNLEQSILEVSAHEFFHIVTPLNLHSEIIHTFNFEKPVASKHLWLYEGITEWASHKMLLEAGLTSIEDYLNMLSRKVMINQRYYAPVSLEEISKTSFSKQGQKQYGNVYMKGALVAGLLDLKILELSKGKKDLMNIINELTTLYGPEKPFNDNTFFDTFTSVIHPDMKPFIDNYIRDTIALPLETLYQTIGIHYLRKDTTNSEVKLPFLPTMKEGKFLIAKTFHNALQVGDIIVSINGKSLDLDSFKQFVKNILSSPNPTAFEMELKRGTETLHVKPSTIRSPKDFVFKPYAKLSDKQAKRQQVWLGK